MFRPILLGITLLTPVASAASTSASFGAISCSNNLTLSVTDGAYFQCAGDFSISGGTIISDLKITIAADGSLVLENMSISAPLVELTALNGVLSIADSVSINTSPSLPIPEPSPLNLVTWQTFEIDNNVSFIQPQPGVELSTGIGNIIGTLLPRNPASGGVVMFSNQNNGGIVLSAESGVIGSYLSLSDIPSNGVYTVPLPGAFIQMILGTIALSGLAGRKRAKSKLAAL